MNDPDAPATKADLDNALRDMERDLKNFILEREIIALRWTMGLLGLYFFGTLASVWFLINQQTGQVLQLLQHYKP